jgi:hypothetical protein
VRPEFGLGRPWTRATCTRIVRATGRGAELAFSEYELGDPARSAGVVARLAFARELLDDEQLAGPDPIRRTLLA